MGDHTNGGGARNVQRARMYVHLRIRYTAESIYFGIYGYNRINEVPLYNIYTPVVHYIVMRNLLTTYHQQKLALVDWQASFRT